jgi:hypothetical protein
MSNNQPAENIMERLEQVDSKLEKLLAIQALPREGGLSEPLNSSEEEFSEDSLRAPSDNDDGQKTCGPSESSNNPLPSRVAISAREMDSIFRKVNKINHDAEILERVGKLERQNRKITILGSMFMTLTILALGAFGYLMIQGNFLNKEVSLHAGQKVDPPKSFSGEAAVKENSPQLPAPITAAQNPMPAEPVLKVSDPQPVTPPADSKSVEGAAPVKYVGYMASNKYHYPGCKWAARISHYKHWTFSSVKEAREKGYIPCSTCRPPGSD